MIDIHSHLLHSYDDGPTNLEDAMIALKKAEQSGTNKIILTPHFIKGSLVDSNELKESLYRDFIKEAKFHSKIEIEIAAETYLYPELATEVANRKLVYPNTNFILVETSMSKFPFDLEQTLYDLLIAGYRPILAHPERYQDIIINPDKALDLMHRNVYLQINAGSLLGEYGNDVMKTAWNLINQGHAHFLASDYHGKGEYLLKDGYDKIVERIDSYTADLLCETNPKLMLNNEAVPFFYVEFQDSVSRFSRVKSFFSKVMK